MEKPGFKPETFDGFKFGLTTNLKLAKPGVRNQRYKYLFYYEPFDVFDLV
jgi:hypothetical protein